MNIETWPISRPIPYAKNARKIPERAVDKVAASLREFGWRQPVVVDTLGVVVVGHTRLLAAKKLGMENIPVHIATELTTAQIKAYRLMDNRSHEEASWDFGLVTSELAELKADSFALDLTGFDNLEIARFLKIDNPGLTDPDHAPELGSAALTKTGEVWLMGKHRLMCGDSENQADVEALLAGAKPNLMVTDPPYGVNYNPKWRLEDGVNKIHQKRSEGIVGNDHKCDWRAAWSFFPGTIAYVWFASLMAPSVGTSLESCGFQLRSLIIWAKPSLVIGRGHYHWQHEPCWYAVKHGATAQWTGDRKQSTLWEIPNMHRTQGKVDDGKTDHSTQKPVECMKRPMENNSEPGAVVYDPFGGSGTSLIAAHTCGRVSYSMEIEPLYCDMSVRRWQNFTGEVARLESTGESFSQIEGSRKS